MKKITLLSDTHSYMDDKILEYCKNSDEIWHAGDIGSYEVIEKLQKIAPVRAVYGNIDDSSLRKEFPLYLRFRCEEVEVVIIHIGGSPKKYTPESKKLLQEKPVQLFICGHSHVLKVLFDKENQCLYMNPGAIGKHGFHQVRTLLQFEIEGDKIQNLQVVEMKR